MKEGSVYNLGIDAGSTTVKVVVVDPAQNIVYKAYRRHRTDITGTLLKEMREIERLLGGSGLRVCVTGSAGIGIAERIGAKFVQEVVASAGLVRRRFPQAGTLLDIGGEDTKIVFLDRKEPDIRMNGSCAGGTGAFIDQMATLMHVTVEELGACAGDSRQIYPIASRCGVFAKTDIQNLISRNVPAPDIAASTLHAVALQSVTSLAHGCEVKPPVLCIGGPLTFISALRREFCEVLGLAESELILAENSEYFPAWGAALQMDDDEVAFTTGEISERLGRVCAGGDIKSLPPLFEGEDDYRSWQKSRRIKKLDIREIGTGERVDCFLGIDSGSTTTKIAVTDADSSILFRFYANNDGNSLARVAEGLELFFREAEDKGAAVNIVSSAVTGYGEDLIRSALNVDYGIVETMAHLSGAGYVDPQVSFVLDIGGQDIKSLFIAGGVISNVELNEACSAGCGSFLQNFASTINMDMDEFSRKACLSAAPCDLGSRCTVFMNSMIKQSLRDNTGVDDIAAGLAYSVVKNCLFKVLKISNLNKLGDHIVVQGGTFRNDAVYRALELLSGKSVSSTDHPELMGAFGAALHARSRWETERKKSVFGGVDAIRAAGSVATSELQCKGCTNKCSVLKFKFDNGNACYAGNKCEKVFFNSSERRQGGYNAFERKTGIVFDLPGGPSNRGTVGIPRVLNMFDNYPFWHTLFTGCGFRVALSPESDYGLYQRGVDSVMSDNICFPAKLVHGHIRALAESGVDRIFYPIVPKETKEFGTASNSWNCPVVSGYPDVVRSSMDPEGRFGITFDTPVINFNSDKVLRQTCGRYFEGLGVSPGVFGAAFDKALRVKKQTRHELACFQKELLDKAIATGELVFVVTGRPYHTDPLVNQKTGQILADLGVTVLTDDVFREDAEGDFGKLNVVSQWSYPNRVVQSALMVAALPNNVQLVQLNSFGCGPDSFFMDEASNILRAAGKNLTVVRVDEIASPGSVRLRLRSLVESVRNNRALPAPAGRYEGYHVPFIKKDARRTILIPWLTDFISPFIPALGELAGYNFVNLPKPDRQSAEMGLKYGHNEVCYPSTLVLGDIIKALESGNYDLANTAVAISQTGGQCRATNYIAQIKTGLERAGFTDTPIVALTTGGTFQNDQKGFKIPWLKLANITVYGVLYGDALQQMYASTIVREKRAGASRALFDLYVEMGCEAVRRDDHRALLDYLKQAVETFNEVEIDEREPEKIGVIGEIYVKYNDYGQSNISRWLRGKGVEAVTPPVLDFIMQYFVNAEENKCNGTKRTGWLKQALSPALLKYMNKRIGDVEAIMKGFRFHRPSQSIFVKAQYAAEVLSLSNQFGEGWLIAAEVAHFARMGINKVVCLQPFGCIANHIVAKGVEKRLKTLYPEMSLLYLDIDSGVAEVNLHNRLHFMIG